MNDTITIINEEEIEKKHIHTHSEYEYYKRKVTKRGDYNQCYVAIYDIPPLKSAYPYHYHTNNTEAYYIISGIGIVITPTGKHPIKKGDILIFPPTKEGAHKIKNTSTTEMLTYIDFDTTNSPDILYYPDSNKMGVIVHNESSHFYKLGTTVDYYEDE